MPQRNLKGQARVESFDRREGVEWKNPHSRREDLPETSGLAIFSGGSWLQTKLFASGRTRALHATA